MNFKVYTKENCPHCYKISGKYMIRDLISNKNL